MSIKKDILGRTRYVYLVVLLLVVILVFQMFKIQLLEGKKYREMAKENASKNTSVIADRGNICARDGRLLACSVPYFRISFDCSVAPDSIFDKHLDSLSLCLHKYFKDRSKSAYKKLINKGRGKRGHRVNKYLQISKRELRYQDLSEIKKFPIFRLSKNKGGLIVEKINKRIQPHINLANRTIGDFGQTNVSGREGRVGIEGAFERDLRGINGKGIKKKMIGSWLTFVTKEPKDGNDVITTIDINYQDIAETELEKQLTKFNAESGTVVLMEVKTGAVRAIANLARNKSNTAYYEGYNYAIGSSKEYGSVFKLASMIALLEDGYVKLTDTVHTGKGRCKFYDRTMIDSHRGGFGTISVEEVFEKSSNVGVSKLISKYYKKRPSDFVDRLYSMGLNNKLGISILGEGAPLIKYPTDKDWYGTTLPWMSIGYEVHLTPLQILTFYNSVANRGVVVRPRFVDEIRYRNNTIKKMEKEIILSKLCSENTLKDVKKMLEGVVESGTATNIRTSEYKIAGKTGTALISEGGEGYKNKKYIASFVGYFPADNPTFSCIVVVNNPDKSKGFYGTTVAAPVFKALSDKVYAQTYDLHPVREVKEEKIAYPYVASGMKNDIQTLAKNLDLEFTNEYSNYDWVRVKRNAGAYKYIEKNLKGNKVPNVRGMSLKDALYVLENIGLKVSFSGVGNVVRQSIRAGSNYRYGTVINLKLK